MARYGTTAKAVTRDLEWGIQVPLDGDDWEGKCIYVWFEAVQGYLTCSQIWSNHSMMVPRGRTGGLIIKI